LDYRSSSRCLNPLRCALSFFISKFVVFSLFSPSFFDLSPHSPGLPSTFQNGPKRLGPCLLLGFLFNGVARPVASFLFLSSLFWRNVPLARCPPPRWSYFPLLFLGNYLFLMPWFRTNHPPCHHPKSVPKILTLAFPCPSSFFHSFVGDFSVWWGDRPL